MRTLVYKFGLMRPVVSADAVRSILGASREHYNDLVRVQRGARAELRSIEQRETTLAPLETAKAIAEQDLEEALAEVARTRSKSRSRSENSDQLARVKACRAVRKEARSAWSAERSRLREDGTLKAAKKAIAGMSNELANNAYQHSSLKSVDAWGTRALVSDAIDATKRMPLYEDGEPSDPTMRRWDGSSKIGVSLNQRGGNGCGLTPDEVHSGADPWFSILRRSGLTGKQTHGSRRSESRATLRMRIGTKDREGIYAEWPMVLHRGFPDGAVIRYAEVSLSRIGSREVWSAQVTIFAPEVPRHAGPSVAVDIGWRKVPAGVLVATWVDSDGRAGQLVLPDVEPIARPSGRMGGAGVINQFTKAASLKSIRGRNLDEIRANISDALEALSLPDWMAKEVSHLHAWRSPRRFVRLARLWEKARFAGDERAFDLLAPWCADDRHLWDWETSQHKKAQRRRLDMYRTFARGLANTHGRLVTSDANYAALARRNAPEGKSENETSNGNRTIASPGELRTVLEQAFLASKEDRVDSRELSTTCPACGHCDAVHAVARTHDTVCTACTYARDADTTAALNMLRAIGHEREVADIITRARQFAAAMKEEARDAAE